MAIGICHRYLGSVIFAFQDTLTITLHHKTCNNTSGQGFFKKKQPYSLSMKALIANRAFFKTLSRSVTLLDKFFKKALFAINESIDSE